MVMVVGELYTTSLFWNVLEGRARLRSQLLSVLPMTPIIFSIHACVCAVEHWHLHMLSSPLFYSRDTVYHYSCLITKVEQCLCTICEKRLEY